jgi:hypothetical protein
MSITVTASADEIEIGPFTEGEKQAPLTHTFQDANGNPLDLTAGYEAVFVYQRFGGLVVERTAVVDADPATGKVSYMWDVEDFSDPGAYRAQFWVGNGTNRFASQVHVYAVAPAISVPDI